MANIQVIKDYDKIYELLEQIKNQGEEVYSSAETCLGYINRSDGSILYPSYFIDALKKIYSGIGKLAELDSQLADKTKGDYIINHEGEGFKIDIEEET